MFRLAMRRCTGTCHVSLRATARQRRGLSKAARALLTQLLQLHAQTGQLYAVVHVGTNRWALAGRYYHSGTVDALERRGLLTPVGQRGSGGKWIRPRQLAAKALLPGALP